MDPVFATVTIDRPREVVFAYLADLANHPEFSDHYLQQWHLTRTDSWGEGAGARYRVKRRNRFAWGETTFIEVVDVSDVTADAPASEVRCLREAAWSLELPDGFKAEHRAWAVSL